jgi:hypothetical protein
MGGDARGGNAVIGRVRPLSLRVRTIRALSILLASVVATVLLPAPAAEGQDSDAPEAVVVVSPQNVTIGGTVEVTGSGWQPGSLVVADICGNEAAGGSLDCTGATSERGVDGNGRFTLSLTVLRPPSPCPCVVTVTGPGGPEPVAVPLEIEGHPEAPVEQVDEVDSPAGDLEVDDAYLEGSGPWSAWFGASPSRTLVLTVRNNGDTAADLRMTVHAGVGGDPEGWVPAPDPGRLEPGESRTLRIPVDFDPLGFGRHTVAGEIEGVGSTASFAASEDIHPWGLYGVGAALLILAVTTFAVRRRRGGEDAAADIDSDGAADRPMDGAEDDTLAPTEDVGAET